MYFIKYDYILAELRNTILETINNIIFIFNSYLVITAQNWHIYLSFVNFLHISRTITRSKITNKRVAHSASQKSYCSYLDFVIMRDIVFSKF